MVYRYPSRLFSIARMAGSRFKNIAGVALGVAMAYCVQAGAEPTNLYWGDTHVHTSNSQDAGRTRFMVGPAEAYRYAKGEVVESNHGTLVRMIEPLDFLVVADHAEFQGVWNGLRASDPLLQASETGRRWQQLFDSGEIASVAKETSFVVVAVPDLEDFPLAVWQRNNEAAERANQPGLFTAFIGYEYSSMPGFNNLHRVVIFKDGADLASRVLPFSAMDSVDPEDLWRFMADYETTTGGDVLAIPHNGNISDGLMFALITMNGEPLSRGYAQTRSRWEPLVEITQLKSDSETHPLLSPADEFADYRVFDKGNMTKKGGTGPAKNAALLPYEYVRSALKLGLDRRAELGVNPFKFGVIGSTDSHTGLTTIEGQSYVASNNIIETPINQRPLAESKAATIPAKKPAVGPLRWTQDAGGLAAVWATGNTREELFVAMERRETYATTGPRITVRFFGGWDYEDDDALRPDLDRVGYAKGVPMGGDLTEAPAGRSPGFLILAARDPRGANLDRLQVIKGWRERSGELREKVYDVALADDRVVDARGKVKPVGNTVNVSESTHLNSIGDPELSVVWHDPDFDRSQAAFYYVRVLEIPTPRWTDRKSLGIEHRDDIPTSTVERAYTSPIWYTP